MTYAAYSAYLSTYCFTYFFAYCEYCHILHIMHIINILFCILFYILNCILCTSCRKHYRGKQPARASASASGRPWPTTPWQVGAARRDPLRTSSTSQQVPNLTDLSHVESMGASQSSNDQLGFGVIAVSQKLRSYNYKSFSWL
jgi:hypothetical protein